MKRVHADDYEAIPQHVFDAMERYVNCGVETGPFLRAVISNDLKDAVGRADRDSYEALPAIVGWFYNEVPSGAWGTRERYKDWTSPRGKPMRERMTQLGVLPVKTRSVSRREVDEEVSDDTG